MTGEMSYEDLKEGYDYMFDLAEKINKNTGFSTSVQPFDQYQGAYVWVSFDIKGKFYRDGRKMRSGNLKIWKIDNDVYFIEKRTQDYVGYHVPKKDIYKLLKALALKNDFKFRQYLVGYS